jgi:hypothetical protein
MHTRERRINNLNNSPAQSQILSNTRQILILIFEIAALSQILFCDNFVIYYAVKCFSATFEMQQYLASITT